MRSAALLLLCAALSACAPKPDPSPGPVVASATKPDPAPAPVASTPRPDPAPAPVASFGIGEQPPIEALLEFTPTEVRGTLLNHTESDLEFRTWVRVIGGDWRDAMPPLVGPDVPVKAGSTSAKWSIALPPLPDGYYQLMTRAATTRGRPFETGFDNYLRVERAVATVIDSGEWYEHTGSSGVTPSPS